MSLVRTALAAVSGGAASKVGEIRAGLVLGVATGLCAIVAVIFLLIAATIALAAEIGAVSACLIMASVFAVLAALLFLRRRSVMARKRKEAKAEAALAAAFETNSGSALSGPLMALAAGYALARKD
jgi:uncharacterized membrane protein YozB (DUF420 family)